MTINYTFEQPSIETLVKEIVALNHAWKAAKELFGDDSSLAQSTRDLKACLQVRLLRTYPEQVYLIIDNKTSQEAGEQVFSVRLKTPITIDKNIRDNAEHLPVRVAEQLLNAVEIKQFEQNNIRA